MNKPKLTPQELSDIFNFWVINKAYYADKMGMPKGTFNNKLNIAQWLYSFTDEEQAKLEALLKSQARDMLKRLK